MHIGGDGKLQNWDFEVELIDFLKQLERKHGAELIINGDAFGLWEFTTLEGTEKLEALIKQQPRLFEQFRKTGEKVPITLMPGNHDYELACYPDYVDRLKEYNLNLVQEVSITREVAGKKAIPERTVVGSNWHDDSVGRVDGTPAEDRPARREIEMKVTESSVPKKGVLQPPSETLRAPSAACRAAAHNVPRSQAHLRSLLFNNNVHLKFGQELLGHASVTITLET
jgi:hypothetical protein